MNIILNNMKSIKTDHINDMINKSAKLRKPNVKSNSLSVTIPADIVKELGLSENDKMNFTTKRNGENTEYEIEFVKD